MLTSLILDVHDLESSLLFYRDLLRIPVRRQEAWEGHRLAYLDAGAVEILLMQQPPEEQNPELDRSGGMMLKLQVENLAGIARGLQASDAHVLRDIEQAVWGERTVLVADPDGYAVLLSEPTEPLN